MAGTRDRLLSNAGGLLIAAGAVAAFAGGSQGLATQSPGLIVAAVVLLMGYGIVGYLLMSHGERYFQYALPGSAILVVATIVLFQAQMGRALDDEFLRYVMEPALVLLLVFAAGALLTHVVEDATARVAWPGRGARSLNALLHVSAYAPIWCAFTLLDVLGRAASPGLRLAIVGGSVLAAIASVIGGYAATRGSHPAFTVIGAGVGFVASGSYLFQFMLNGGPAAGTAFFGQFNALIGLILTGLPVAIGTVAWIQVGQGDARPDASGSR